MSTPRLSRRRGTSHTSARYRPEIDGLRAIAVLAVILFHIAPRVLPGGYLGVDVFFVISGFVISASLAQRPASGLGDLLVGFYSRRIRRLLPALLLCVLGTAVALCLVNPEPGMMLGVGWRALIGTSNLIQHKLAVDYFRPAAELNPFTQTWSLGVEEQFYLLFPLLVWWSGFARHGVQGHRRLLWFLLPLVLASLALFVRQLSVDEPAAYFLLPARFWELGVGCVVFLLADLRTSDDPAIRPRSARASTSPAPPELLITALALAALLALLGVMALPMRFGALPVAATVGFTALLLASLRPGTPAHGLLSRPPLVFIGLISYSLYLWHWSVLSLARWTVGVNRFTIPALLALMLVLAVLSWRFVEEPLRREPWWPERWRVVASGLALVSGGVLALQGLTRFGGSSLYLGRQDRGDTPERFGVPRDCSGPDHARLLVVGDSHAHVFQAAANHLCGRHGLGYREAATVGMPYPTLRYTNAATGVDADEALRTALAEESRWSSLMAEATARHGKGDVLVLSLRWPLYFDPGFLPDSGLRRTSHFDPISQETISRSQALNRWIEGVGQIAADHPDLPLVLLLPTPEFGGGVPAQLCEPQVFRPRLPQDCIGGIDRRPMDRFASYLQRQLAPLRAQHRQILVIDPLDSLCPPQLGRCPRVKGGKLLYSDGDHLSLDGAMLVLDDLVTNLRRRGLIAAGAFAASTPSTSAALPPSQAATDHGAASH